jgi:hypothetical protein
MEKKLVGVRDEPMALLPPVHRSDDNNFQTVRLAGIFHRLRKARPVTTPSV